MGTFLKAKPIINYTFTTIEILKSIATTGDGNTLKGYL